MVTRRKALEEGSLALLARAIVEQHPTAVIVRSEDDRIVLRLHAEPARADDARFLVLTHRTTAPDREPLAPSTDAVPPTLSRLTKRQREVLGLLAEGYRSKQIAAGLGVSVKTVDAHRGQIMERLGIRDIAGLVRFAIRVGLVPRDP